jgi:hypothetical protein
MNDPEMSLREEKGTFVRTERRYCRHCRREVMAVGPARAWRWLLPLVAFFGFLGLIAIVLIDPFGLVALVAAGLLIALLGPYVALARRTPTCPTCRREVPFRTRDEAEAATRVEEMRARREAEQARAARAPEMSAPPESAEAGHSG